jgi:hypothetical protein
LSTPPATQPSDTVAHHDAEELFEHDYHPGLLLASLLLFLLSLFLLLSLGEETKWFKRVALPLQPRFWPAVVLAGMTFFSCAAFVVHVIKWRRRAQSLALASELMHWIRPIEFALWFVLYAAAIPYTGYLLSTLIFMPLLGMRVGLRSPAMLLTLVIIGVITVLFFKTGLSVNIPAGAIYDYAPDGLRDFLVKYF